MTTAFERSGVDPGMSKSPRQDDALEPLPRIGRRTDFVSCPLDDAQVRQIGRLGDLPQLIGGEAVLLPVQRNQAARVISKMSPARRPPEHRIHRHRSDVRQLTAGDQPDLADAIPLATNASAVAFTKAFFRTLS